MSYQVTNLKKQNLSEISGNEILIITDVDDNNKIETKKITISDLTEYVITASDISNVFRTGSFMGNFIGNLTGSSDFSDISTSSSISDSTNNLIYSDENGISSYSMKSKHSLISNSSLYSESSSRSYDSNYSISASRFYKNDGIILDMVDLSDTSVTSYTSSISQKTYYVSGSENDTVYHSMYSEKSIMADVVNRLSDNNSTRMLHSVNSDHSYISSTSSFSEHSMYSHETERAAIILGGNVDVWAHCSFQIDTNYNIIPLSWNNIHSIDLMLSPSEFPGPQILIVYQEMAPKDVSISVKSTSSPFTPNPINDFFDIDNVITSSKQFPKSTSMYSWASSCSNTAARISIYGYSIRWGPWRCVEKGVFGLGCEIKEKNLISNTIQSYNYLRNCIFSFAAFMIPSPSSLNPEPEEPPTTFPDKC